MIIDFSVENFRSFSNKEVFSMIPDSGRSKTDNIQSIDLVEGTGIELLKSAVVYGANGSGKSNFIKALYAMKWFVTNSMDFKVDDPIRCYEPFELDVDFKDDSTKLEMTFIFENTRYQYQISYKKDVVLFESLDFYLSNQPANLFKRDNSKSNNNEDFTEVSLGKKLKDKKIPKKVFRNQLYLSKFGSDYPHDHLTKIYKYFSEMEIWNALDKRDVNKLSREISKKIAKPENIDFSNRLSELVRIADIKIESIFAKELSEDDFNLPDEISEKIRTRFYEDNKLRTFAKHAIYKNEERVGFEDFDMNLQESRGTKVLFALGGIILDALDNGGIVIFDELDNSLHPKLCKFLIRLFNNPISNPLSAQLIFATHEVTLLDKETFRKDQIWFTEKNKYGRTELFSAKHIEGLRDDTNFELWYRTGKFGGNPKIKEVEFIFGNE
ncbi:AAA family ATPase [Seonamhaeicola maritimus]|uniref:ATP-binding protein n=1 Tax=Seonamhaeicola maritimus TaxID=2591822 RepID=A0A5C7GE66_9FLAO|nr:ATP-binding protein [Seonamhaeicola maritimus]TXG34856.1 ATP-binding protein [Seonamhaeicola maritimus]